MGELHGLVFADRALGNHFGQSGGQRHTSRADREPKRFLGTDGVVEGERI